VAQAGVTATRRILAFSAGMFLYIALGTMVCALVPFTAQGYLTLLYNYVLLKSQNPLPITWQDLSFLLQLPQLNEDTLFSSTRPKLSRVVQHVAFFVGWGIMIAIAFQEMASEEHDHDHGR
jgi:branched-subunit amino acid transport protein